VIARLPVVELGLFVGRHWAVGTDGIVGTRIDNFVHADVHSGAQGRLGATDVDVVEEVAIGAPVSEVSGSKKQRVAALERASHGVEVADVAVHPFHVETIDIPGVARSSHQNLDIDAVAYQLTRHC
jgi:hypothetical protein